MTTHRQFATVSAIALAGVAAAFVLAVQSELASAQMAESGPARITDDNGKLRDELLNTEIFYTLKEATILIEQWRRHYNAHRPHSSLGYRPTAPETIVTASAALAPLRSARSPEAESASGGIFSRQVVQQWGQAHRRLH